MATETKENTHLIYRLTFDNRIGDADKTKSVQLILDQGINKEFTDGSGTYSMLLKGVKANRQIYQPTEIEVELDIMQVSTDAAGTQTKMVPDVNDIKALFLQREVTVELRHVEMKPKSSEVTKVFRTWTIASSCYVYELNPQIKRDNNDLKMYVKMNIFSMDKLMTLNKYSKAYVARKLGSGILKPESQLFGMKDATNALIETDITAQQHLGYKEGEQQVEFIQPYLVQYNESFYDFLVRTANRCGEFLFFENGKLTLGLPDSGTTMEIKKYETVTLQQISSDPLRITPYARDSVKDGNGMKDMELNQSVSQGKAIVKNDSKGNCPYPSGVFPKNISSNAEYASDDYIFPLIKDKFTSWKREMFYDGTASQTAMAVLIPFFASVLTNESGGAKGILGSLAKAAIGGEALMMANALMQTISANSEGYATYMKPYETNSEQATKDKVVQFASLMEKCWTKLDYYNDIHKYEDAQQRMTVCIDMGTTFVDVKLGQKITIEGLHGTYVVIQIKQRSEETWGRDYEKYGASDSGDRSNGSRSLKIYAIPAYKDPDPNNKSAKEKYYPPVAPVPVIRRADPQTAFIAANVDPKYQGRVRIAFPWQSLGGAEREMLEVESGQLQVLNEKLAKLKEQAQTLLEQMARTEMFIQDLKLYVNATKEERKAMLKTRQDKLLSLQDAEKKKEALEQDAEKNKDGLEQDAKNNKEEIGRLKEEIDAQKKAAEEHDKKKSQAGYKDLEKDNSVILKYKTAYDNASQSYQQIKPKEEEAEKEVEEKKKVREALSAKIDNDVLAMSSPWVRVVSPMATPGGGTFFRPRVGDEVMVNFENGNVERPYVMGSLYSKNVVTPDERLYRKKAPMLQWSNISMAMMSPNGHHITFTDPPAGGNFFFNAISPGVGFYSSMLGAGKLLPEAKDLAGGIHIGDRHGIYEITMQSHKRSIDIKSPFGTVSIDAFSGITISAPNGDITIKGQNVNIEAGNKLNLISGKNVNDKPPRTAASVANGIVGAAVTAATKSLIQIVDISLIRKVIDTFVRPIDGTMLIKSKRYLKIEAGHGNATIATNRYAAKSAAKKATPEKFFNDVVKCVNFIKDQVTKYYATWETLWKEGANAREAYEQAKTQRKDNFPNFNKPDIAAKVYGLVYQKGSVGVPVREDVISQVVTFDEFKGEIKIEDKWDIIFNLATEGQINSLKDAYQGDDLAKAILYQSIENLAQAYAGRIYDLLVHQKKGHLEMLEEADAKIATSEEFRWLKTCVRESMKTLLEDNEDRFVQWKKDGVSDGNGIFLKNKEYNYNIKPAVSHLSRHLALSFLAKVAARPENNKDKYLYFRTADIKKIINDKSGLDKEFKWYDTVMKMDRAKPLQNGFLRAVWDNSWGKLENTLKGDIPAAYDRKMWKNTPDGQILFSDQVDYTLNFNGEGLKKETSANQGSMEYLKKLLLKL